MSVDHEPYSREELLVVLGAVHREATELFAAFSPGEFFRRPNQDVWSPGENAIHLVKSVKAVADAMKLPKTLLRGLYGTAKGSRSYSEVRALYREALAKGGVASGRYVPSVSHEGDDAGLSQARALDGWQRAGDSLEQVVGKWSEAALDKYRMPHPLIGKLTVREMLFFTHYHDRHHIEVVRREPR